MNTDIINLFTNSSNIDVLSGGQGESCKVGDIVIKPVYEEEKYIWHADNLEKLDFQGVQYSKPIKSKLGNYTENSYCATSYIPGSFFEGRLKDKIHAANTFNSIIKGIEKPIIFNQWTSPWTRAQDVAWSVIRLPESMSEKMKDPLLELEKLKFEIQLQEQLIHCDFAGNILFNDKGPIIIDFTPGFYPPEYSIACLVVDSIAWHNSTIDDLLLIHSNEFIKYQLTLRAVMFRLLVPFFFDSQNIDAFDEEYQNFMPIITWLKKGVD